MPGDLLADPRITLLGPQRQPRLGTVVQQLGLTGSRFATITAGWRDRESDDGLLHEQLGGNAVNLHLWRRMQQVWEADPELEQADRRRRQSLTEMQTLYLIGLEQAAVAINRILEHTPLDPGIVALALQDVLQVMRDMDERHLQRVGELHHDFYLRQNPEHRDAVVEARFLVGREIAGCDAIVIPGGHVGVLLGALHLFNLGPALSSPSEDEDGTPDLFRPVIAWGAGAMALTERVLLFYDNAVARPGVSEMLMDGLALTRDVVALPSPKDRLDIKNLERMRVLAARTAPAHALLLDEGVRVTLTADGRLPAGSRVVGADGQATDLVLEGEA
ncbi:hypothetical protein ACI3ET_04525 [Ornithinimicrobium sp. LYQ121]|uniref:hypothetical protein n=1 Tax=Ornithinimicrobium sp. LYQ121 TaxID=3378801 RepID=UPI00385301D2